ncbi:HNH endonuclease signature motif containing protein [Micrococcoides hystricis]|uniref:HNH endonuclease signature motif containing protein n=1 Tax=Micrococcoides hystricis TaxID=1572761 RepID=A0ABV6P9U6_9MICC
MGFRCLPARTRTGRVGKTQLGTALAETAGTAPTEEDFRRQARNLREQHHPKNAQQRHSDAHAARRISVHDCGDGMSTITGFIPTTQAHAIERKIKAAANAAHKKGQAAGRTRTQLEADLFVHTLLTGTDASSTAEATSKSTHSVLLLLDLEDAIGLGACLAEDQLGYLEHKYPELHRQALANREHFSQPAEERISPHPAVVGSARPTARDLVSGEDLDTATAAEYFHRAQFMRTVITDPISGYPLGLGRRHQPDQALKELIIARDQHCRHPGCHVPPRDCELNHTDPWAHGGATSYTNLELECRHHHTGLSARWWSVTAAPHSGDGARTFTDAATGRHTTTQPQLPLDAEAWEDYRARLAQTDQPPF